jgi:Protein of unknown function (DUF3309)
MTVGTILLIIVILALLGTLPTWPYSSGCGYYPSGGALDQLEREVCRERNATRCSHRRPRAIWGRQRPGSLAGAKRFSRGAPICCLEPSLPGRSCPSGDAGVTHFLLQPT